MALVAGRLVQAARIRDVQSEGELTDALNSVCARIVSRIGAACSGINASFVLVGPPGSGKSAAVCEAIRRAELHAEKSNGLIVQVRLHGRLHADERTSLLETAAQLARASSRHADRPNTTRSIQYGSLGPRASIGEILGEISAHVLRLAHIPGCVFVFVLDAVHLFAAQGSAGGAQKQTLLYCLLNLLQGESVRGVFIGITPRIDVVDLLEKRVKSRFSGEVIAAPLPDSVEQVCDFLKKRLKQTSEARGKIERECFCAGIDPFFKDQRVLNMLSRMFMRSRTLDSFLLVMSYTVACADTLQIEYFLQAYADLHVSKHGVERLLNLSSLELMILYALTKKVSSVRQNTSEAELPDPPSFSFDAVYAEYQRGALAGEHMESNASVALLPSSSWNAAAPSTDLVSMHVALKAYEHLVDLGLVLLKRPRGHHVSTLRSSASIRAVPVVPSDEVERAMLEHPDMSMAAQHWVTMT
ncbi:Origin recognition complex subunit 4 [Porphyridium purpureum]|uniref:Origin recognition complex subunit 4 n=1 Tax=Porphyridium purpureum TaxID=35688 RepID=A0A5J4Z5V7_PORPP|nr:Origin recognition complex subunit 4 [Porphyridium purpureum]|eukprot:POR5786..scf295_1